METIKKECQVVMLPTNEKSHIYHVVNVDKLRYVTGIHKEDLEQFPNQSNTQNQHLYILIDDEIKKEDFVIQNNQICIAKFNKPILFPYKGGNGIDLIDGKKIISSTNSSLNLPQPSQAFIKKYCELNGKIDKVMVEYNQQYLHSIYDEDNGSGNWTKISKEEFEIKSSKRDYFDEFDLREWVKTNSKNEISISSIKDSWNIKEVEELCKKAYMSGYYNGQDDFEIHPLRHTPNIQNWMKENL